MRQGGPARIDQRLDMRVKGRRDGTPAQLCVAKPES